MTLTGGIVRGGNVLVKLTGGNVLGGTVRGECPGGGSVQGEMSVSRLDTMPQRVRHDGRTDRNAISISPRHVNTG